MDVLYAMHDCALGISPVTSFSGAKKTSTGAADLQIFVHFVPEEPFSDYTVLKETKQSHCAE